MNLYYTALEHVRVHVLVLVRVTVSREKVASFLDMLPDPNELELDLDECSPSGRDDVYERCVRACVYCQEAGCLTSSHLSSAHNRPGVIELTPASCYVRTYNIMHHTRSITVHTTEYDRHSNEHKVDTYEPTEQSHSMSVNSVLF